MLTRSGSDSDVVASGEEALRMLAERPYGLVLMDVQMPGMDGREATRRWRRGGGGATAAAVPVVALTAMRAAWAACSAHVGQDDRDACAAAGMDDYRSKPFGVEALATMCRRRLDGARAGSGVAT